MKVVVYGSLRKKEGEWHWMSFAEWLGDCTLDGYSMYDLGYYPAAVVGEGAIFCEVYRIDSTTFMELNDLKIHQQDFTRKLISTPYGKAWLYLYTKSVEGFPRIGGGNWVTRETVPTDKK